MTNKLKILLISYGSVVFDGRLRELIDVCRRLGSCTFISNDEKPSDPAHIAFPGKKKGYKEFIRFCREHADKKRDYDLVLADNRRALYPAYQVYKKQKKAKFVIDTRELYVFKEVSGLQAKLGCLIEKWLNPKADLIIAAGAERAAIMQQTYHLTERPLVFENVRALTYPENYQALDRQTVAQEILDSLKTDQLKLISTSGCSFERSNDRLVQAAAAFKGKVKVYLVGSYGIEDYPKMKALIAALQLEKQVYIIKENLREGQLKEFIGLCDVGVVNYSMKDLNNKYCASGKIYEFLCENKPVITTENPPLKNLLDTYQIGAYDDQYTEAIRQMLEHYEVYAERVKQIDFATRVAENNQRLAEAIKQVLYSRF